MISPRFVSRDPHGLRAGFRVMIVEVMKMRWTVPWRSDREGHSETVELGVEDDIGFFTTPGVLRVYAAEEQDYGAWATRDYLVAGDGSVGVPVSNHPDFLVARLPMLGELFESEAGLLWVTPTRVVEIVDGFAHRALAGRHGCSVYPLEDGLREFAFDEALDVLVGDDYCYNLDGPFGRTLIERLTGECAITKLANADEGICRTIAERVHLALQTMDLLDDTPTH